VEEISTAPALFDHRGYSETSEALGKTVDTMSNDPSVAWAGIKKPYAEAWECGDYGAVLGRVVLDPWRE
jgi:hypothetical protein